VQFLSWAWWSCFLLPLHGLILKPKIYCILMRYKFFYTKCNCFQCVKDTIQNPFNEAGDSDGKPDLLFSYNTDSHTREPSLFELIIYLEELGTNIKNSMHCGFLDTGQLSSDLLWGSIKVSFHIFCNFFSIYCIKLKQSTPRNNSDVAIIC